MKRSFYTQAAIVGSAMFTGVMLTIGLALGRYWWSLEPQEFALWFSDNLLLLLPCVALTLIPAFAGFVGAVAALRTALIVSSSPAQ